MSRISHHLLELLAPFLSASLLACGAPPPAREPTIAIAGTSEPPSIIEPAPTAAPSVAPPQAPAAITWETSERDARDRAKARRLPILVFLCADWAAASARMDRAAWTDPRVIDRSRSFVMLRLDATSADATAQAAADRFDLRSMPSTVVLDDHGRELARIEGFAGPDDLLTVMSRAAPPSD